MIDMPQGPDTAASAPSSDFSFVSKAESVALAPGRWYAPRTFFACSIGVTL